MSEAEHATRAPLWFPRPAFLEALAQHPSPHDAGEHVWELSEPWILAIGNLAEDPAALLAEVADWCALLDRHSLVDLECMESGTQVRWSNLPGVHPDPRECLFRLGALTGLLASGPGSEPPLIEHPHCLVRGDEDCLFTVGDLLPRVDPPHVRAFREASLLSASLQGWELMVRSLRRLSARHEPFPDVRELRGVRRFIEEIEDIVLILDPELRVLDANRAATRFLRMLRGELRGLSARDFLSVESFARLDRSLPGLFQKGAVSGLHLECRTRSGYAPIEVSLRVSDNHQTLVCIAHDISAHRRMEQELEARNRQLKEQNEQITDAARLQSEFLANVSHELTTPLTCIHGFAKLLRQDLEVEARGQPPRLGLEKRVEFLQLLEGESQRMSELIGSLLELSKIESGMVALDCSPLCLNGIAQDCARLLKPRFDEFDLRVRMDLDPALPKCLLDPDRMKQVMLNLLDNAAKFSPDGSEILIRTAAGDGHVRLGVRNPAPDLQASDLSRIFARFVQRDGSFSRQHGGVGLGLDLVRAIVELHGGRIWADLPLPGHVEFAMEVPIGH